MPLFANRETLYFETGWETLKDRHIRRKQNLFHKIYNHDVPIYLIDIADPLRRNIVRNLRNMSDLELPNYRLQSTLNSFFPSTIKLRNNLEAKEKYRGMIEIQKSGDKTSSGEIGLDIRTHASPKVGQDQVSGGVSVLFWHAAPVAYVLLKPGTWSAIVKITKNEHDETTYSESMERIECLIALKCCLDICGHLPSKMLDLKVKVKVQVDLWGHKVGHVVLL